VVTCTVIDRTNDGRPDVVVRLRVGRFVVPEKKECSEEEASHAEKDSGRAETAVLVFENTGSTLRLTAASASSLRRLAALNDCIP
jgi:hypothetical protein